MNKTFILLAFVLALALPGRASPPTAESIDKLLVLSRTDKTDDLIIAQMNNGVSSALQQVLKGQQPTAADQAIIDSLRQKIASTVNSTLSWPKLKALYEKIYIENFSQSEVDALDAFFDSPAGKAFAEKEPLVAQQANHAIQEQMEPVVMELQPVMREAIQKLISAHAPAGASPAAPPAPSAK